jgi:hypothetical protein
MKVLVAKGDLMGLLWLGALVGLTVLSVSTANGAKWKLINVGIILAGIGLGLLIGWAAGTWGRNDAIGADIALPLAICLGAVAALGSWRRNKMRDKKAVVVTTTAA